MNKLKQNKYLFNNDEVTSEENFLNRRKIVKGFGALGLISATNSIFTNKASASGKVDVAEKLELTPEDKVVGYNNFYEFGFGKGDPAKNSKEFTTSGWNIDIKGEVEQEFSLNLADLEQFGSEERIYRMRCVEAWSMVIPWLGFELNKLIKLAKPTANAKYVVFKTLYDPEQMPGQKNFFSGSGLKYPYIEALTLEEAMHPLTLLATGLYGKKLLPQNGAPIRLVVPWKYGFKSIKSIVSIEFSATRPLTTWESIAPDEYGFYANVNPLVDHPRWSQASERVIGGGLFSSIRRDTELFNGYADQVAYLYKDLDLEKNY